MSGLEDSWLRKYPEFKLQRLLASAQKKLTVNRITDNIFAMAIQSFSCAATEALFTTGVSRRFVNIKAMAERKLAQLDAAPSLLFMKAPPGNDLKEYNGVWHVRINRQWRLCFKWGPNGPYDVHIDDPH
jgi:proteic killer suppression protein